MRVAAGACCVLAATMSTVLAQRSDSVAARTVLLRGVTIVDVLTGELLPDRNIWISGDRITAIAGPGTSTGPTAQVVVSGSGKFVIPGLWDMHATLTGGDAASFVARGVTGVREMGPADLDASLQLYRDIEAGKTVGPRLLTGGPGIRAATPTEAREAFDRLFDTDADFVRFHSDLDFEAYIALAERSRKWRYLMAGPLPPSVRLRDAISLRQSSIEGLDGLMRLNREEACEGFKAAANAGVWFTPLLTSQPPKLRRKAESLVQLMRECGALLLAGGDVFEELQVLMDAGGFSPAAALRTATIEPARYLHSEDSLGSVAAGKFADMVILDANPLEDLANLQRVSGVILRGRYFNRTAVTSLRRPPTIRWWSNTPSVSTSGMPPPAASSAKPPVSSAKPASAIR